MRDKVMDYIVAAPLQRYNFSRELPYIENGTPLHLKRPLTIFVDEEDLNVSSLFRSLDGNNIDIKETRLDIIFANDAKNTPNNYGALITYLLAAKDVEKGFNSTDSTISTEIVDDLQVTTVELTFTKIA
tara:strand:+ start:1367 stop:1753 length:387 start_codon:yes stop_codon:yes gene_type:complete